MTCAAGHVAWQQARGGNGSDGVGKEEGACWGTVREGRSQGVAAGLFQVGDVRTFQKKCPLSSADEGKLLIQSREVVPSLAPVDRQQEGCGAAPTGQTVTTRLRKREAAAEGLGATTEERRGKREKSWSVYALCRCWPAGQRLKKSQLAQL